MNWGRPVRMVTLWGGLALWAGPVMAQAPADMDRVALWPLMAQGVQEDQAYQVTAALKKEMDSLLGPRSVSTDQVESARNKADLQELKTCMAELRCALLAGEALHAGGVVTGGVRLEGEGRLVELRLVEMAHQREVGRVSGVLPKNEREVPPTLRELAARLVAPEKHLGTLVVNGMDAGVEVFVDGMRRVDSGFSGSVSRVALPVGKHMVEVRRTGKLILTEAIDVRFEEIMVLMAPAPGTDAPLSSTLDIKAKKAEPGKGFRLPIFVGPLTWLLAGPPAILGALFLADLFYIGPTALRDPASCLSFTAANGGEPPRPTPGATPLNTCGSFWRYTARKEYGLIPAVAGDAVVAGLAGLLTLGVVGLGAVLLAASLVPLDSEPESPPAEGTPPS